MASKYNPSILVCRPISSATVDVTKTTAIMFIQIGTHWGRRCTSASKALKASIPVGLLCDLQNYPCIMNRNLTFATRPQTLLSAIAFCPQPLGAGITVSMGPANRQYAVDHRQVGIRQVQCYAGS